MRGYLQVEQDRADTARIAALPGPVLAVTWGGTVRHLSFRPDPYPLVALVGPLSRDHCIAVGAGVRGFHVRLGPTGARVLLGERPVADAWDDGLAPPVWRWAEAVAEAASFEDRVALADAFWRSRLPGAPAWSDAAVRLVARSAGTLPVAALAAALSVSLRTLHRRFSDDVGLSTKTFAQIERYRHAHGFLLRTPEATWRDVCERYRYADQAHFVRAFRRFTGDAPTRWRPEARTLDLGMGLRDEGT